MYTANTMASAIETLGMTLPYSSSTPAEDPLKLDECFRAGAAILNLLELDLKPRDIMTREAFENAMVMVAALGGSTNAVFASDRDGPVGQRSPDHRRFPDESATRLHCWPISSPAATTSWKICKPSAACLR